MKAQPFVILMAAMMLHVFSPQETLAGGKIASASQPTYCASHGESQFCEYIHYVAFSTIARSSGPETDGYYDGSANKADVIRGASYNFTYSAANPTGDYTDFWAVYIDWNNDGDFDDPHERAFTGTTSTQEKYSGTIDIPADAVIASTRMRVSMHFGSTPPPCGEFDCGEVEDYTLNILSSMSICTESYEPNNNKDEAKPIEVGKDILSQISVPKDVDWFSFTNSESAPNIKVTLTNLPADYDLKLNDPSGVTVKSSTKEGREDETIVFNTYLVGTWKVAVTGVKKSFSNTGCYTLRVSTGSAPYSFNQLNESKAGEIKIFPDPASNVLVLLFNNDAEQLVDLRITDHSGEEVFAGCKLATTGSDQFNVDVSLFPDGIYNVELKKGETIQRNQFMVVK